MNFDYEISNVDFIHTILNNTVFLLMIIFILQLYHKEPPLYMDLRRYNSPIKFKVNSI